MLDRQTLTNIIKELGKTYRPKLGDEVINEMAIPSYTEGYFISRYIFWRKLDWIMRFASLNNNMTVLDFGSGSGILLPELSVRTKRVYACDLHIEIAKELSSRLSLQNIEFITPDKLTYVVPDNHLDLVIAANVLEHINDRPIFLEIIRKKLKSGGRLIVSGPTEGPIYRLGRKIIGFKGDYHVANISEVTSNILHTGMNIIRRRRWPIPGPCSLYHIIEFIYNTE